MTLFFVLAALLVVLALAILLYGLFRNTGQPAADQLQANVRIARERQATLHQAHTSGDLDDATYAAELRALENSLALDISPAVAANNKRGNLLGAAIIIVFVPITAGALYLQLGTPIALDDGFIGRSQTATGSTTAQQAPALADLIPRLEQRLADNPDDADGWKLLGRTYMMSSNFAKADTALRRALELDDQDPDTLAQLAEATAMQRGGALVGEPAEFLQRALDIDATHEQSIWLMAMANQQSGEHKAAIVMFDQLAKKARDNPQALEAITEMTNRSRAALGMESTDSNADDITTAQAADPATETDAQANTATADSESQATISVSVSLTTEAAAQVSPEQVVFIYARASDGPPMPLAAIRLKVSDLPATVTLDDSMAMVPGMSLSSFAEVSVGARVSQSGNAIAEAGDWFGEKYGVPVAETRELTITIDKQK